MTSLPNRWSSHGIEVTISFPRWFFRMAMILVGLLLIAMVALAVVGVGRTTTGDSSFAFGMGVTGHSVDGHNQRFTIDVHPGTKGESYPDSGWTVLFENGSISPARVLSGPARLESGKDARVEIEVGNQPGVAPIAVRFDPDNKLGFSLPLNK